jgi:CCR4-NOT transcription complex subunit 1
MTFPPPHQPHPQKSTGFGNNTANSVRTSTLSPQPSTQTPPERNHPDNRVLTSLPHLSGPRSRRTPSQSSSSSNVPSPSNPSYTSFSAFLSTAIRHPQTTSSGSQQLSSNQLLSSASTRNNTPSSTSHLASSAAASTTASHGGGGGSSGGGGNSRYGTSTSNPQSNSSPNPSQHSTANTQAGQLSKIVIAQIFLLLSTIKEDKDTSKWESQADQIRKVRIV